MFPLREALSASRTAGNAAVELADARHNGQWLLLVTIVEDDHERVA